MSAENIRKAGQIETTPEMIEAVMEVFSEHERRIGENLYLDEALALRVLEAAASTGAMNRTCPSSPITGEQK